MRRLHGFTLIELLVVIAIVAVLAAILFPVFAQAKRASKKTTALSNVGQILKASTLYIGDNDDRLPFRFPMESEWKGYGLIVISIGDKEGFNQLYDPYLKNPGVWYSPEDRLPNKGYTSFAFNEQLAFAWPLSQIPRPSEAVYLTDRTDVGTPDHPAADTYVWWEFIDAHPFKESDLPGKIDPISVATQISPIRYTGNVGVYGFLDAHAAALPFAKTWGDAKTNLHLATKP